MLTLPLLVASYREIVTHKWLALRAVVVGWSVLLLLWILFARRLADLDFWFYAMGWADFRRYWDGGRTALSHFAIGGLLNLMVGYIVGRLHPRHRRAMVMAF